MHRKLETAFRNTHYLVSTADGELLLRIDRRSPELSALLRDTGAGSAALLTAFNPGARKQAAFLNRRMQRRLRIELAAQGFTMLEGRNEDPRGRWPVEPSLLVLDLQLARAQRLAARYGQVALLWMTGDGVPRLVQAAAPPHH